MAGITFLHFHATEQTNARIYIPFGYVNIYKENTYDHALDRYLTMMALWGGKDTEMVVDDILWVGYEFSHNAGVDIIVNKLATWDKVAENEKLAQEI